MLPPPRDRVIRRSDDSLRYATVRGAGRPPRRRGLGAAPAVERGARRVPGQPRRHRPGMGASPAGRDRGRAARRRRRLADPPLRRSGVRGRFDRPGAPGARARHRAPVAHPLREQPQPLPAHARGLHGRDPGRAGEHRVFTAELRPRPHPDDRRTARAGRRVRRVGATVRGRPRHDCARAGARGLR